MSSKWVTVPMTSDRTLRQRLAEYPGRQRELAGRITVEVRRGSARKRTEEITAVQVRTGRGRPVMELSTAFLAPDRRRAAMLLGQTKETVQPGGIEPNATE